MIYVRDKRMRRDRLLANKQTGALGGTIACIQWTERSRLWECFLIIEFHNKMLGGKLPNTQDLLWVHKHTNTNTGFFGFQEKRQICLDISITNTQIKHTNRKFLL